MGRTKHEVKKELWEGDPLIRKIQFAAFGDKYSGKAASLTELVHEANKLECGTFETVDWPGVHNADAYESVKRARRNVAWKKIAAAFAEAIQNADGTIFRQVADYIEMGNRPLQKLRALVGCIIQECLAKKNPIPTRPEMRRLVARRGIKTNDKQIDRVYDYFEVDPPSAKRGRKPV